MPQLFRNFILFIVCSSLIISCDYGDEYQESCAGESLLIKIDESDIPTTGIVNQTLDFYLKTDSIFGCYSNFEINMIELDSNRFFFEAIGRVLPCNFCSEELVAFDTIISFTPTFTGNYFFQANEDSFHPLLDTLEIN